MATNWDGAYENAPAVDDSPSLGYKEFNDLKENIRLRFDNEHVFDTSSPADSQQGWHRQGSAIPYYGSTAPSARPDGTSFSTADLGRLWYNTSDETFNVLTEVSPDPVWEVIASRQFALLTGTAEPDDADGEDGDIYFQYEV